MCASILLLSIIALQNTAGENQDGEIRVEWPNRQMTKQEIKNEYFNQLVQCVRDERVKKALEIVPDQATEIDAGMRMVSRTYRDVFKAAQLKGNELSPKALEKVSLEYMRDMEKIFEDVLLPHQLD